MDDAATNNENQNTTEDELVLPTESHQQIILRHEQERRDLKKRFERMRSRIPKKDRVGRMRAAEDAQEEEKRLLDAQAVERLEAGIPEGLTSSSEQNKEAINNHASKSELNPGKTESKAARRRRKKAEKEAASQRRIEQEKANMGPSPKFLEIAAIEKELKPKNLQIHNVPPDGNCLYSAVADQIIRNNLKPPMEPTVSGLRQATADCLFANKEAYMPFIEDINGDEERFRQYCDQLRTEAVWGGQVELRVLAELLETPIEVYAANVPTLTMGEKSTPDIVLRVSYHREYYSLGEHYNSVIPKALAP